MDYKKPSLLHSDGDPLQTVKGFNFTRNDFEDLIDNFTPFDDIPILLGVCHRDLDKFCMQIYRSNFKTTYDNLLKRAQLYYRKSMMMLSKMGNPSAIKLSAEYYVGLGKVADNDNRITFVTNMPITESDVEVIKKIKKEFD